jgi:hypothetical protein
LGGRGRRFAPCLFFLLILSGCGEEGGFPPVLTEVVTPRTLPVPYLVGFNDGQAPLAATVGFEDPDGDVVLMTVTWQDCGASPAKRLDIVQEDLKGTRAGVIPFFVSFSTNCPAGVYSVSVFISDERGFISNSLEVPYELSQ